MVWHSAPLPGSGKDTKGVVRDAGGGGSSTLLHPHPRKLALAPLWWWWGCQCSGFLAFHLCLGSWLGCQGIWGGSLDGDRGCRYEWSLTSHWLSPFAQGKIKHQKHGLVPGLMEPGKPLPDVCSCFSQFPSRGLDLETPVSHSVGPGYPGLKPRGVAFFSPIYSHSSPLVEALASSRPLLRPRFLLRHHQLGSPSCCMFYILPVVIAVPLGLQEGRRETLRQRGWKEKCLGII